MKSLGGAVGQFSKGRIANLSFQCFGCSCNRFEFVDASVSQHGVLRVHVTCAHCRKIHVVQLSPLSRR